MTRISYQGPCPCPCPFFPHTISSLFPNTPSVYHPFLYPISCAISSTIPPPTPHPLPSPHMMMYTPSPWYALEPFLKGTVILQYVSYTFFHFYIIIWWISYYNTKYFHKLVFFLLLLFLQKCNFLIKEANIPDEITIIMWSMIQAYLESKDSLESKLESK